MTRKQEQEHLLNRIQDLLARTIAASGMSRADVARKLHRHRSFVTTFLKHDGLSPTIANAAALAWATGHRIVVGLEPIGPVVAGTTASART